MSNAYESTFIVDAHLSNEQIESTIQKISKIITDSSGEIILIDRWGKRRLAYEIAKKQYGYYVNVRFNAEGSLIKPLEREYKLNDHIIRFLTVSVPKAVIAQEAEMKEKKSDSGAETKKNKTDTNIVEADSKASVDEKKSDEDKSKTDQEV